MRASRRHAARVVLVLLLAGCAVQPAESTVLGPAPSRTATPLPDPAPEPEQEAITSAPPADLGSVKGFRSVRGFHGVSPPSAVRIPAIGVNSSLVALGREPDGSIAVPDDFDRAGWYSEGPVPGQPGPAVILGHVDSRAGPAVFHRLRDVGPGDEIIIDHEDGTSARFVVDRVERFDKNRFPTHAVYYPTLDATLRLITCGGTFDESVRSYRDNVIVFAAHTGGPPQG